MRLLLIISLLSILSITSYAQDSAYLLREKHLLLNENLRGFYGLPALYGVDQPVEFNNVQINFQSNDADRYILQRGSGFNDFNIGIDSYKQKLNNLSLWGKFQYNNIKASDITFNESLDYDYLYPYLMTDTVGGDLRNEHYYILGGVSKLINQTTYALETSFIGKQSIRNRDPRLNNISSNLSLKLSAARQLNSKYILAVSLNGERYFQKAKLDFNSQLGRPTVFHETGLGNYNRIFADTRDGAEYLGYNYGLSLSLVPYNHLGWFAKADYLSSHIAKKIEGVAAVINDAHKSLFTLDIGYQTDAGSNSFIEQVASFKRYSIKGIEGKFDNRDAESALNKINEENLFNLNNNTLSAHLTYKKMLSSSRIAAKIKGAYINTQEQYKLPAAQEDFTFYNLSGSISLLRQFRKKLLRLTIAYSYTDPISAEGNWTGLTENSVRQQMLIHNFSYKNTAHSHVDISAKFSFPLHTIRTIFLAANYQQIPSYSFQQFGCSTGISF